MFLFGFGTLFYAIILLINAVAILSEDRFLARIGWGRSQPDAFGASHDSTSVKAKSVDLIASVRTVMRSMFMFMPAWYWIGLWLTDSAGAIVPLIGINSVIIVAKLIW